MSWRAFATRKELGARISELLLVKFVTMKWNTFVITNGYLPLDGGNQMPMGKLRRRNFTW